MSYKYEYYANGSCIYCRDSHGVDAINAMCLNPETARSFVNILNDARKPEAAPEINSEYDLALLNAKTAGGI